MRILFIHQNFPGQFVHLAPALANRGHEVRALKDAGNKRPSPVPAEAYALEPADNPAKSYVYAAQTVEFIRRGTSVALHAEKLRAAGYVPDVVVGHFGWGETLYIKEVWPKARLVVYAEFFYRSDDALTGFDPEFQSASLRGRMLTTTLQGPILLQLATADAAITPTAWQAQSFPDAYRHELHIIHDGIDTGRVAPGAGASITVGSRTFRAGDEVVTFVNHTLEPFRGYHTFMRALPAVLAARPAAHALIVGGDEGGYGARPPAGKSWRQIFLDEVRERIDVSRVHFLGKVPYDAYLALLRISRVHTYLTYPGVLSWSLIESMSTGCCVIGSRTPPVEEVIVDGVNGRLVDFFDVAAWSAAMTEGLAHPERQAGLRQAARQTVLDRYDLATQCLPRLVALIEAA